MTTSREPRSRPEGYGCLCEGEHEPGCEWADPPREGDDVTALALIGREWALISKVAHLLHDKAKLHYDYTSLRETPRGYTFGLDLGDGREARVTVEMAPLEGTE